MKIAIDISQIVYGTGVSAYTENLVENLLKLDSIDEYILFAGTLRRKNDVLRLFPQTKIFPIPPTLANLVWNRLHTFPIEKLIGKVDVFLSITEIPTNREVQYETPHPAVPLDEEANIENPCAVDDITESANTNTQTKDNGIVVFHNGTGIMCLEALSFLRTQGYEFTEYLNTDEDYSVKINEYKADFEKSEGMSETFSYYPIIFIKGRAFSGFNQTVQKNIEDLME